jgi:ABC-type transport system involved in multi-copper enzyme maturation permease subunit
MERATWAIARLTFANGLRQPITWLTTAVALGLLLLCMAFGMFNFITQDRMNLLMSAGIAVCLLNGLFLGVVSASDAVHDELASRTALTLFAKPMGRGSFLVGKALGTWGVVIVSCLVVVALHLAIIAVINRQGFDFYESRGGHHHGHDHGEGVVDWLPWARIIAGQAMAIVAAGVMTCVAATLALRLPLVANVLCCFGLFVLAHLLAGTGHATTVAGLIPSLALFNLDDALHFDDMALTPGYFVLCLTYAALYACGALSIGLALFKRQDIP